MKRHFPAGIRLLPALAVLFISAHPLPAGEPQIAERTLANGLKILVLEKHTTPAVAVQVWYRVGSHDEPQGVKGMAHFVEHMMFRGSEHVGSEEHARMINERGGDLNGFTSEDYTAYIERLPACELELALRLEADRMMRLKLDSGLLATEANVVREEYRMSFNNPMGELFDKAQKLIYGDHPYATSPLGLMTDLESLNVARTRRFYELHYAPNHAVLIVVGDVRAESVFALAEREFGPLESRPVLPEPDLSVPEQKATRRFREKLSLPVPITALCFWIPPARHADIIPLQVLSAILSGGESSRLQKSLVRDRELAVAALGFPMVRQGNGFMAFAAVHLPNIPARKIEQALWQELDRLKTEPVTEDELQMARQRLLVDKVFQRYSGESVAMAIGYAELAQGDYHMYQREVEEYGKVTKEDIMRVARTYFPAANATILSFQPRQSNLLYWLAGVARSVFGRKS